MVEFQKEYYVKEVVKDSLYHGAAYVNILESAHLQRKKED